MFVPRQLQWHIETSSLSSTLLGCAIEVDVTEDSNLGKEWITGTTSDAAGKMQPVKVSATQIFHTFNELACLHSDLPKNMKGKQIKKIPNDDAVIPLPGNNLLHV
eukprot:4177566-Ditylum_brightwellii.AAC.1